MGGRSSVTMSHSGPMFLDRVTSPEEGVCVVWSGRPAPAGSARLGAHSAPCLGGVRAGSLGLPDTQVFLEPWPQALRLPFSSLSVGACARSCSSSHWALQAPPMTMFYVSTGRHPPISSQPQPSP